jgi:hypothetical protein
MGAERNLLGRRKDGSEFPIEVGLYPITIQAVQYTTATVIDITERSLAAKALSTALTERDRLRRNLMRSAGFENNSAARASNISSPEHEPTLRTTGNLPLPVCEKTTNTPHRRQDKPDMR